MDTDSLMYSIKTEDFYADIVDDVEERFDMSVYIDRPLPTGKNKKFISLMKDELGEKDHDRICGIESKAVFLQDL